MNTKKKSVFCKIIVISVCVLAAIVASFSIIFIKTTWSVSLDTSKLETVKETNNIIILDSEKNEINTDYMFKGNTSVCIEELPEYVKQAFIVTEDKRFYKHNGVDYKRIVGAALKNLKSGAFTQGASTISQQLIKNTHLTREKTLSRKLKEIKLAYKLEKKYTKDEILEMYLNNIYFGNGCYGLEKAANYYFNKKANDLSVGEACMLAGTINAPSVYNPISNNSSAEKRKKLILKLMKKSGKINNEQYQKSANINENVVKSTSKQQNTHIKNILNETCEVLNISANKLKNMNLVIETYIDNSLQNYVSDIIKNNKFRPTCIDGKKSEMGIIVVNNKDKSIVAVASSSGINVLKNKRQPASTIKPILVYAPAFEYGLLYPESIIIDEKININGYSPNNANKTFMGAVSVRDAVEKSLNIPAVKTLSKVGVERAKKFASKLGVEFSENDKNLALALGGMTDGLTIKQLADAYSTFATNGGYKSSKLIKRIIDNEGNVLYEDNKTTKKVMSSSTAYLITDLLRGVVNNGTARRLNSFGFDLASKTGTVGSALSNNNTDAFNVAYTSEYTIVSWIGALDENSLLEPSVNGSTYPTLVSKDILQMLYKNNKPKDFSKSEDVVYEFIDTRSLKSGVVELADNNVSNNNKKVALFNKKYLPEYSKNFEIIIPTLEVSMEEGLKPTFNFIASEGHVYTLIRCDVNGEEKIIKVFKNCKKVQKHTDYTAKSGQIYEYYLNIERDDVCELKQSNSVKLLSF